MRVGKLYLNTRKKRSKQTINANSYFINFFHNQPTKFLLCEKNQLRVLILLNVKK